MFLRSRDVRSLIRSCRLEVAVVVGWSPSLVFWSRCSAEGELRHEPMSVYNYKLDLYDGTGLNEWSVCLE